MIFNPSKKYIYYFILNRDMLFFDKKIYFFIFFIFFNEKLLYRFINLEIPKNVVNKTITTYL
ncbi:hypothetical protein D1631_05475 [Chryseobacterium nematophagum]|uniref:Uncharacterized protein n=1 Tax=Chryseobacterium nematophagum TaxID=2305228 RepID=A0A3M7TGS6_9FLAO|nr:hypothetical protein D1631_05475 [Chryseobacterium nematophagum]